MLVVVVGLAFSQSVHAIKLRRYRKVERSQFLGLLLLQDWSSSSCMIPVIVTLVLVTFQSRHVILVIPDGDVIMLLI
jgi:hypothetical protein